MRPADRSQRVIRRCIGEVAPWRQEIAGAPHAKPKTGPHIRRKPHLGQWLTMAANRPPPLRLKRGLLVMTMTGSTPCQIRRHSPAITRRLSATRWAAPLSIGLAALVTSPAIGADQVATDVSAKYKLSFNGFDVGNYYFKSKFDARSYSANSQADVSAMFGAFKWRGSIETSGAMQAQKPRPAGYVMTFKTKSKTGSVTLDFNAAGVKTVTLVPSKPPNPEAVPLSGNHLKNVFDPLSAILAMTNKPGGKPCDQRVPIFDGKARFDLALSYKGTEKITDKKPSGQPSELLVCRVKYLPIAGHKAKDFDNPWVDYNNIEIAFRPIPTAGVYVPYRIAIPTTLGTAMMQAEAVTITSPDHPQIALTQ